MELRQLKTFLTVAELLSFHGAAKALGYAQSTVSAQVQGLEESLGAPLFERLGRRIALTRAGERLVEYARRIDALSDEARGAVRGEGRGRGRMVAALPESVVLLHGAALVRLFCARHPEADLSFARSPRQGLAELLGSGKADLALTLGLEGLAAELAPVEHAAGAMPKWRACLVVSRAHPLAGRLTVSTLDLSAEALLYSTQECGLERPVLAAFAAAEQMPERTVEFSGLAALLEAAASGVGVGVVPERLMAAEAGRGCGVSRLAVVQWEERMPESRLALVRHAEARPSELVQGFVESFSQVAGR